MRRRDWEGICAWALGVVVSLYIIGIFIAARHRIAATWREDPTISAPAPGRGW